MGGKPYIISSLMHTISTGETVEDPHTEATVNVTYDHCVVKGEVSHTGSTTGNSYLKYGEAVYSGSIPDADKWYFEATEEAGRYCLKNGTGKYLALSDKGAKLQDEKFVLDVFQANGGFQFATTVNGTVYYLRFSAADGDSQRGWTTGTSLSQSAFEIFCQDGSVSEYDNTNDAMLYRVAVFSDLHVDYALQNDSNKLVRPSTATAADYLKNSLGGADMILVPGDMTSDNAKDGKSYLAGSTWTQDNFTAVRNKVSATLKGATKDGNGPVLYVAGNHDYEAGWRGNGGSSLLSAPAFNSGDWSSVMPQMIATYTKADLLAENSADFQWEGGQSEILCYLYQQNGIYVLGINSPDTSSLNNNANDKETKSYFFNDQAVWVKNQLNKIEKDKTVIILSHYSLEDMESKTPYEASKNWKGAYGHLKEALESHPNAIYVYGHAHGGDSYYAQWSTSELVRTAQNATLLENGAYLSDSYITAHGGSMYYYNNVADGDNDFGNKAEDPAIVQFLTMDFYTDHITFRYYNTGTYEGETISREVASYTVMRDMKYQLGGPGWDGVQEEPEDSTQEEDVTLYQGKISVKYIKGDGSAGQVNFESAGVFDGSQYENTSGKATYDPEKGLLILENLNTVGIDTDYGSDNDAQLTVLVRGTNTLTGQGKGWTLCGKNLVIKGEDGAVLNLGSTANDQYSPIYVQSGVTFDGDLTVNFNTTVAPGATVTVLGEGTKKEGRVVVKGNVKLNTVQDSYTGWFFDLYGENASSLLITDNAQVNVTTNNADKGFVYFNKAGSNSLTISGNAKVDVTVPTQFAYYKPAAANSFVITDNARVDISAEKCIAVMEKFESSPYLEFSGNANVTAVSKIDGCFDIRANSGYDIQVVVKDAAKVDLTSDKYQTLYYDGGGNACLTVSDTSSLSLTYAGSDKGVVKESGTAEYNIGSTHKIVADGTTSVFDKNAKTVTITPVYPPTVVLYDTTKNKLAELSSSNPTYTSGNGTASYDAETGTLTVENLHIGALDADDNTSLRPNGILTLVVKGVNTFEITSGSVHNIFADSGLVVKGDGTLNLINSDTSKNNITVRGSVTFGGDVKVNFNNTVNAKMAIELKENGITQLTVKDNAKITATNGKITNFTIIRGKDASFVVTDNAEVQVFCTDEFVYFSENVSATRELAYIEFSGNAKVTATNTAEFNTVAIKNPTRSEMVVKDKAEVKLTSQSKDVVFMTGSKQFFTLSDKATLKLHNTGSSNPACLSLSNDANVNITGGTLEMISDNGAVCSFRDNGNFTWKEGNDQTLLAGAAANSATRIDKESFQSTATNAATKYLKIVPTFSGMYASLGDDISLTYYLNCQEGDKVQFQIGDYDFGTVTGTYDANTGRYAFCCENVSPKLIGDTIVATLLDSQGATVATKTYSIKEYLVNLKADPANANAKDVINALLNYGAAAQTYTDYKTENLVNDGIPAGEFIPLESPNHVGARKSNMNGKNFTFDSANVYFDGKNRLMFKFTTSETGTITFKVEGPESGQYTDGAYQGNTFYTCGISASKFWETYTVTAYVDGVEAAKVRYSVNSYVYAMQDSTDANLQNLVKATYLYGVAANAYKSAQ